MAKALIGHLNSDLRTSALTAENARLRARVGELEALLVRLSEDNDRLAAAHAATLIELETASMSESMQEMQPA